MRSSERVAGAELGEDRDHHPAQEIAAVGIVGLGDRRLELLEGVPTVAGVPGGKRLVETIFGGVAVAPDELEPGEQAVGEEVALEPSEELAGLLALAALDKNPPEGVGRLGVARV